MTAIPTLTTLRPGPRPPAMADFDAFAAYVMSHRSRYAGGPLGHRLHAWFGFTHLVANRHFGPLVRGLQGGPVIGHGGPHQPKAFDAPDLAWAHRSGAGGCQGYATEAVQATKAHAAGLRLPSPVSCIATLSRRVAERLGGIVSRAGADLTYRYWGAP